MRRLRISGAFLFVSVAFFAAPTLQADELLAQSFSVGAGSSGFSAGLSTSDGDLAVLVDYASSNPHPLLLADAITGSFYKFDSTNSTDFNAIAALLTDGINEEVGFGYAIVLNTGGMLSLGGIGVTEFQAFSGCSQSPIHVGCGSPNLGPDLVGDQITSITVTISDVLYQDNFTANPGNVGVNYSATAVWQIYGTGTPLPSAGPTIPPPPPPAPEPASVCLILTGPSALILVFACRASGDDRPSRTSAE
jgi:hypothetical protein